jgi:uncharacterized protein (TIGR01777 family)
VLSRQPKSASLSVPVVAWSARPGADGPKAPWRQVVARAQAVVNLSGAPISRRRWTGAVWQALWDSRVGSTQALVEAMADARPWGPRVLVCASATGYYGACGDEEVGEEHSPGDDPLARLCQAWEAAAVQAEGLGARVVRLRTGVVWHPQGGMLAALLPWARRGVAVVAGHGEAWVPWIHREDWCLLAEAALTDERVTGAVNLTSPQPVRQEELARTLVAVAAGRGRVWRMPAWMVRAALGDMGEALLLSGQRAIPKAMARWGYVPRWTQLAQALWALVHGVDG